MAATTCPKCGRTNREGAQYCQGCGSNLSTYPIPQSPDEHQGVLRGAADLVRDIFGWGKEPAAARAETKPLSHPHTPPPAASVAPRAAAPVAPRLPGTVLTGNVDPNKRYALGQVFSLSHSNYYAAYHLTCSHCQHLNPGSVEGQCQRCGAALSPCLVRERARSDQGQPLLNTHVQNIVRLSSGCSFIVPHQDVIYVDDLVYVVLEHPGAWRSLVKVRVPCPLEEVTRWGGQLGQALSHLHERNFVRYEAESPGLESIIIAGEAARLADISTCQRVPVDTVGKQAYIARDTLFLAQVLFYLSSGKRLPRSGQPFEALTPLRRAIERGMQGMYAAIGEMLEDVAQPVAVETFRRSLKQTKGEATHPGQARERNEDAVVTFTFVKEQDGKTIPVGFYLVADGMGGHEAGEVASRTVNQIVSEGIFQAQVLPAMTYATRKLDETPMGLLEKAIQEANHAVYQAAQRKGSDMGTTITAALILGDQAVVANVGDSRTYLLRGGKLEQLTTDHSIVARLFDTGMITEDEIYTHPQRNEIYRSLGAKANVEVDLFNKTLQAGDQLILCSDGLWEMVRDPRTAEIVTKSSTPQQACDALIDAANAAGGDDNISVIVVRIE
jgi:serine/threonine protein phosphatase PrpC